MKTTLIVPSLNELDGLQRIMPRVKREWCDQIVVLIGRPRKDLSSDWCRQMGYDVFYGDYNLWVGYRNLFKSGLIKHEIVVTFSPDNNSIPEIIPLLTNKIEQGYDMVIASRYLGAKSEDDTKLTGIGNKLLTNMVNLFSNVKYTDALVMFRAYRKGIIKELGFLDEPNWLQRRLIKLSGLYSFEPSLSVRAAKLGLKVTEIPGDEPKAFRERRQNTFIHGFTLGTQILQERARR